MIKVKKGKASNPIDHVFFLVDYFKEVIHKGKQTKKSKSNNVYCTMVFESVIILPYN